jgi:hypothetical protein
MLCLPAYKGKERKSDGTGLVKRGTVRPQQLEHSCWTSSLVTESLFPFDRDLLTCCVVEK